MSDPISDLKQELLAAAERQQRHRTSELAERPRRRVKPLALLIPTTALVATLVVVVLVAVSPWSGSPSVVSEAEAAIAPAAQGQVLYERAEIRRVCLPGHRCALPPPARIEVWVEGGAGTRRFRAISRQFSPLGLGPGPVEWPALRGHTGLVVVTEVGGVLGRTYVKDVLVFEPPHTLVRYRRLPTAITSDSFDPVALIRHALAAGHAHATGTTTIEHHRLRVIQVRLHVDEHGPHKRGSRIVDEGDATYYVDHKTYAPFQIVYHHAETLEWFSPGFEKSAPADITVRFLAFRRVAATPALRAQADIADMHKGAKTICGHLRGLPHDC